MCGIVGVVDPRLDAAAAAQLSRAMADCLMHRGPDDQGHFALAGRCIGMRRLSIIDLEGGHQPIANETGEIHVVCNGEIYNFVELREDLLARGHRLATGSDTEVIVHLYEEYGDSFVDHLRGMFGLAIMDSRGAGRILLARDRLGKKPLFYADLGDGRLLFASEMKSILAAEPALSAPNYSVLGEYLQLGYIHQPRTIYQGIHRLPAAHLAIHQNSRLTLRPYWQLEFATDHGVAEEEWRERLDTTLRESVRIRLRSDVPLGVFLSGGLDSSAVVTYASLAGLRPLKTFTIGFDRTEWDESSDAAIVAKHFQTEHHSLTLTEDDMCDSFEDTLLKIMYFCDEPFGDASALPTYHVSRLARQYVTVVLSGDGGDELFAGYSSYRGMLFAQQYRRWLPNIIGQHLLPDGLQAVSRLLPGSLKYRGQRFAKVFRDSALPLMQAFRNKVSIWQTHELRELLTPEIFNQTDYGDENFLPTHLSEILQQSKRDLVSRFTEVDIQSYLLDDILVKVDRMSMAHSLEVRSPLLDYKLAELAAQMPTRMKIRNGSGKYILRELMRNHLPKSSLRKGKQGFSVPLRDWFRGKLSTMVNDYLLPGGYLPEEIFNAKTVHRILMEHQRGVLDHSRKIWLLLAFASWHRQYQRDGIGAIVANARRSEVLPCAS